LNIRYVDSPLLDESELADLFAEAWGPGSANGYGRVLKRSLWYGVAYLDHEIVGFINLAWDGGAHAFILDTDADHAFGATRSST
jgi:hypothetical protein